MSPHRLFTVFKRTSLTSLIAWEKISKEGEKPKETWVRSTIYKNHPDGPAGYLVRNRKTIKFDAVERTTHYNVYPNQLNRLKRVENCIPSNHSPCFLKLPKIPRTVWFSNPNFRFSHVNSRPFSRADVIHFVNLCAAVFSTLFVIVFYFIVISFFFQYAYK